jgi:hypothetical protein
LGAQFCRFPGPRRSGLQWHPELHDLWENSGAIRRIEIGERRRLFVCRNVRLAAKSMCRMVHRRGLVPAPTEEQCHGHDRRGYVLLDQTNDARNRGCQCLQRQRFVVDPAVERPEHRPPVRDHHRERPLRGVVEAGLERWGRKLDSHQCGSGRWHRKHSIPDCKRIDPQLKVGDLGGSEGPAVRDRRSGAAGGAGTVSRRETSGFQRACKAPCRGSSRTRLTSRSTSSPASDPCS